MSSTDYKEVLQRVLEFRSSIPKEIRVAIKEEFAARKKHQDRVCALHVLKHTSKDVCNGIAELAKEIHNGKPAEQRKLKNLIYHWFVGTYQTSVCPNCGSKFFNTSECCTKSCAVQHTRKNPAVIAKMKDTWSRWEGGHPMRDPKGKKLQQKALERKHGKGVISPAQIPGMKEIREAKCMEKRGVRHPLHDIGVYDKQQASLHRAKEVEIQGRIVRLQGYEPQVAKAMLKEFKKAEFIENDLALDYCDPTEGDRVYYPDFQIKTASDHFVVEVKSVFTLLDDLEVNLLKFEAGTKWAKENGKTFVLAIYDRKLKATQAVTSPNLLKIGKMLPRYDQGKGFPKFERFLKLHHSSI